MVVVEAPSQRGKVSSLLSSAISSRVAEETVYSYLEEEDDLRRDSGGTKQRPSEMRKSLRQTKNSLIKAK
jgi:hypothetical protein